MPFCPKCGKELPDEHAFCSNCGAKKEGLASLRKFYPVIILLAILVILYFVQAPIRQYYDQEILGNGVDCGSNIDCFKSSAKTCSKAYLQLDQSVLGQEISAKLAILGLNNGKCNISLKVTKAPEFLSYLTKQEIICGFTSENDVKNFRPEMCTGLENMNITAGTLIIEELLKQSQATG